MNCRRITAVVLVSLAAALLASAGAAQTDPLPSRHDGPVKRGIIGFVQA
jgi:hypothetical protein